MTKIYCFTIVKKPKIFNINSNDLKNKGLIIKCLNAKFIAAISIPKAANSVAHKINFLIYSKQAG